MLYEIQKIRSVRSESSFDMNVDSPGLGIFSKRIKNRNKPEGIPFKVLVDSAKSLAKQDLLADGTIDKIAENAKAKNIPILLIRGSNDFVVPHGQTTRLYDELIKRGVDVKLITVEAAGHAVVGEQPVKVGGLIRKWLEEKKLVN